MQRASIIVRAEWDPEAEVWVAHSDDVPGLVTEAATQAELLAKLHVMIHELLDMNEALRDEFLPEVPLFVRHEQVSSIRIRAA